ncbi:MAG: hypothetical protein GWP14_09795 [Actinobacteria bacterium]|nr:hypothetical protein [Actinomycetota bacterium]
MKCNRIFLISLALVMFGFLAVNSAHATDWTVTRLTNNDYNDYYPQIWGSNVAVEWLLSLPGIGAFLSVLLRYEVDSIDRFKRRSKRYSRTPTAFTVSWA